MSKESKITFVEGDQIRVLRGVIVKEEADYIIVQRRDGVHRINRKFITTIVEEDDEW